MIKQVLFKNIDNSALVVFRVLFGALILLEAIGAILTGWVKHVLIDPQFTFSFIGFEWLQPLPGHWMYVYYIIMGICGLGVMLGYKYRFSIISFTLMWTATYFMQKASYNNHYYLLILLSAMMAVVPAHRYFSIDARIKPSIKQNAIPQWCSLIFVVQMGIVYTYASIAKLYPDWLDTTVVELLMRSKQQYFGIGDLLQQQRVHDCIAYFGIVFDLLIVPLLLWKTTRKYAFWVAVFFHIFNSIVFQVGVFPYMSLALMLFFFDPRTIRNIALKKKTFYEDEAIIIPKQRIFISGMFLLYFVIQIGLPLRHWVIQDDVLWTEEGHRMSWRMMLRAKSGRVSYRVVDKATNATIAIKLDDYLTVKQKANASTKPDIIWQFSQYLKQKFKAEGKEVAVYVNCKLSVNGKPYIPLIDPKVDLAEVEWNAFEHNDWILPSKQEKKPLK